MAHIIFDLDDTLLGARYDGGPLKGTTEAYDQVILEFAQRVSEITGMGCGEVLEVQNEIEEFACRTKGFGSRDTFPQTLVDTMSTVHTAVFGVDAPENLLRDSALTGYRVFDEVEYDLMPGADEVLEALTGEYHVSVLTKGPQDLQMEKLEAVGLLGLVHHIVPKKDPEAWEGFLESLLLCAPEARAESWAIGNSIPSDVAIPYGMGLNAIHVDMPNWSFEESSLPERTEQKLITVESIRDVLEHVPH